MTGSSLNGFLITVSPSEMYSRCVQRDGSVWKPYELVAGDRVILMSVNVGSSDGKGEIIHCNDHLELSGDHCIKRVSVWGYEVTRSEGPPNYNNLLLLPNRQDVDVEICKIEEEEKEALAQLLQRQWPTLKREEIRFML